MNDLGLEQKEEFDQLYKKVRYLDGLTLPAEGKLLSSKNTEEVMEALYEWLFIHIGLYQAEAQKERLRDEEEAKNVNGMSLKYKGLLEQVCGGNWKNAKLEFKSLVTNTLEHIDLQLSKDLLIDPNFEFNGIKLFQFSLRGDSREWQELVSKQTNLIPDNTEPYAYPNIGELKAKVAV